MRSFKYIAYRKVIAIKPATAHTRDRWQTLKEPMQTFRKVEYTKPFELLVLLSCTVIVFSILLFLFNTIISIGLVRFILALVIASIFFVILKKHFIVKISDFDLTSERLKWNNNRIDFVNIESYKIHWMKGAGIVFKLKTGKSIRLSSNDFFCNSENFVNLCHRIDDKLLKHNNGQIIRKKSFFETKQGYFFAVVMTGLIIIITVFKLFTNGNFNSRNIILMLLTLGIIWSGVRWKRK